MDSFKSIVKSLKLKFKESFILHTFGFTLIELLVVISIIGVLAGFLTANFASSRGQARDAKRKAEIGHIQTALESYRADRGSYPPDAGYLDDCGSGNDFDATSPTTVYIRNTPCDPLGSTYWNGGEYLYDNTATGYTLSACLETPGDNSDNVTSTSPGGSGTCSSGKWYVVRSL